MQRTLVCPGCKVERALEEFIKRRGRWRGWRCKPCNRVYHNALHQRLRHKVLTHYSRGEPSCACCGERELAFLAIDHINGGGMQDSNRRGGGAFYRRLINQGFPAGLRVLCHNCNMALGFYGACPHATKKEDLIWAH